MTLTDRHISEVKKIQQQMEFFYTNERKVKIFHGSTNSSRAQKFEDGKYVDVSNLNNIIEINTLEKYALVEPNVPMDKLVDATLKFKLLPPVVMEFPGITVGGGIQGGAGESSSFKNGLFHDTCLEYEIVLGNGELVTASPTQNEDLFYGTACSYGSLGIITLAKIRLVPAMDYVHLTYLTTDSFSETISLVQKKVSSGVDFIDGIIFNKEKGVVMTGIFSEKKNLPISSFLNKNDEWFYLHVDKLSKKNKTYEEIIPIRDYLFRYDRGAFWIGYYVFKYFKIPFTKFFRSILNRIFSTRTLYRLAHATNMSQKYFVQDLSMPQETALDFISFVDKKLHIYPLWVCPLRVGSKDMLSPSYLKTDLVINVGVWGGVDGGYDQFIRLNRDIEKKIDELGGRKVLYAHSYYPIEEFWEKYDYKWYDSIREKYSTKRVFPDLFDKTKVTERYKASVLGGIIKIIFSKKFPTH